MRACAPCLVVCLLLAGCRVPLGAALAPASEAPASEAQAQEAEARAAAPTPESRTLALGPGAAPGDADGPGGFVPRREARSFYAGAGGRLWYYLNMWYWAPAPSDDQELWIRGEVVEAWQELRRWPRGNAARSPEPKRTVEYWRVDDAGRAERLDNHKDYCLLDAQYTAGAIVVEVSLTLGRLQVRDEQGRWGRSQEAYVLEERNYRKDRGIGAERTRFEALPTEAVNRWGYRVPFSTHPQKLTRSNWVRLRVPRWELLEKGTPPEASVPDPAITPR